MMVNSTENDNEPLLEMKNVTVVKDDAKVLDSLSLNIDNGENIAVLGPNASGKSSFIKTIIGEYKPLVDGDKTVFKIMGKERWNIFNLRYFLGIVTGDLQQNYKKEVNGLDVVLSGFFSSIGLYNNHKVTSEMVEKSRNILESLEILHLSDKNISKMSSGEAKRILIARALVYDPKALVLDEPTNNLDLRSHYYFRESLREITSRGKNIILVTHNIEDIIPEIDRVVLLKNGRIFRDDAKKEVLNSNNLSQLFGLPVEVYEKYGYYRVWC
jgi:iron complex transport system ATP-binding protein